MEVLVVTHPKYVEHVAGAGHPERPERLAAVLDGVAIEELNGAVAAVEARGASSIELERVHDPAHVAAIEAICKRGGGALDPDTSVSEASFDAAVLAAGAGPTAIEHLASTGARAAFCAVRPPGHHAESDHAMGFCLFNSVAIGAQRARQTHGLERAAVIDFDVHHGNGTQEIFENNPHVFYASTHQSPLYPGTGARSETGVGNIVNVPLRPGSGSLEFRRAFDDVILPALEDFRPDILLISAGFDAHRRDPLAQLMLVEADYAWVTERLVAAAARHCEGRIISSLEGGYDLEALGASAAAHVRALMAA